MYMSTYGRRLRHKLVLAVGRLSLRSAPESPALDGRPHIILALSADIFSCLTHGVRGAFNK